MLCSLPLAVQDVTTHAADCSKVNQLHICYITGCVMQRAVS